MGRHADEFRQKCLMEKFRHTVIKRKKVGLNRCQRKNQGCKMEFIKFRILKLDKSVATRKRLFKIFTQLDGKKCFV